MIIGAGLAGYSAAEQLRSLGHEGDIVIVDGEPAPYDRPPLSKELFAPDFSLDKLAFASAQKLAEKRIQTKFGSGAAAIDPAALAVTLHDGEVIAADTILIATGGRARTLPIPGADLPGVHVLRTFADASALRARVTHGCRVVIIGAGLIGAELASSALAVGADVTLIDPVDVPLTPAVGELLATHLHGMHAERGIDVRVGVASAIEPVPDGLEVVLDDGTRCAADLVVVGIGIIPNVELAESAGIEVDGGLLVSADYRTSAPDVFAAGDVIRLRGEDGALLRREEHWEAAQLSGQHAAYGMLGLEPPSRGAPWFWTDRHGIHLEAVGRLSGPGDVVVREGGDHPAVFLLDEGLLAGAAAIDDAMTVRAARRLIDQRIPVSRGELSDPSVPLRSLLKARR
ncbi:NAD(P)/FAD-dependent oxidoreductase [Microbacterium hominis]|uniref:NAD(P)/FAD-dependent oxidoreductase n=1 Tax=Microbacterium hominis TaxID=162426 RepID=UPI001E29FA5B|nr:FAD-dependent oxidoreductase [Microbacterium hominis]